MNIIYHALKRQTFKRILRMILFIILGLLVTLLVGLELLERYIGSDKGVAWLYKNAATQDISIKYTEAGIRYLEVGDSSKPALLLIHGAPGCILDWAGFAKRERVFEQYRLLIPERPGYAGSRSLKAMPSIIEQTQLLLEIIKPEQQPVRVVGHSFGGPVAVLMGALDPSRIERIIAIGGQFDPDNEKTMTISYYIKAGIFKYLMPNFLWVSNVEKLTHPDAQRALLPYYPQVKVPVWLIHGDRDTLVYYENSPFVQALLPPGAALVTMPGHNHPVHFTHTDYVVDIALAEYPANVPIPPVSKK